MAERTRIQLDLTDTMRDLIDELVEETGAATRAEILRRAVSIYAMLLEETKGGRRLQIVGKKGPPERVLLAP